MQKLPTIQRSFLGELMINARLFLEGARLSYIGLFRWFTPTTYLASKILMPLNQILFFVFLGTYATSRSNADFYIIGNAFQLAALNGIYGVTMSVGGDRQTGALPYLFAVPSNRILLFLGRAFFHVIDGAIGVVFGLAIGVVLLGLNLSDTNFLLLSATIAAATISTSGLGLMLGSLSLVTVNIFFINNVMYFLLLLFSGANIPRGDMPAWMATVGDFLPLTRAITAARRIVDGGSFNAVSGLLATELLIGIAYATFGFLIFRWIEFQARLRGTIDRM